MPKIFMDVTPLRKFPQFRRLWIGYTISQLGSQLTIVAVAYQVFLLTHSSLDVGLISFCQLFPSIIGPIFGGSLADAMDRRRLLLISNVLVASCSVALAINSGLRHPAIWPLFVFAAISAGFSGIDNPTRTAAMVNLIDRENLVAANALRTLMQQIAYVVGPAVAGVLLGAFNVSVVFWVDVATFGAAIISVFSISPSVPHGGGTKFGVDSIKEGFSYLKGRRAIQGVFIADINAMVLGMPTALFPAIGLVHFHGTAETVGLLYSASGVGAFLGASLSGWTTHIRRLGRAIIICVVVWGLGITAFGLVSNFVLALLLIGIAGAADVVSAVFRSTILQSEVPDRLRGRLSSIQSAVVQGGPRLGNTEAGVVAALSNTQISVVSGGLGCIAGILLIGRLMPHFAAYDIELAEKYSTDKPIEN
ncbi:MAG TPA: MFS transporter [Acidimicrobiales bacterium]|nr:MFS transporter [Acidimicrobiales bacterium]